MLATASLATVREDDGQTIRGDGGWDDGSGMGTTTNLTMKLNPLLRRALVRLVSTKSVAPLPVLFHRHSSPRLSLSIPRRKPACQPVL